MKCPLCKTVVLHNEELVPNLQAKACGQCEGRWIQSYQYWKWLDKHGDILGEKPVEDTKSLPVKDSKAGKLCPECGHFLTHRKVGHNIDFCLDRCNNCGGIWFDKNEWEVLQSSNLHDEVHFIFSAAWQKQIQEEETKETYEKRIQKIIGKDDYSRLKETVKWVHSNPHKNTILSYTVENKK